MLYFDHAATTPICEAALEALIKWNKNCLNPAAIYNAANASREIVADTREKVASHLGCDSLEIYFNSGGSESDNWAIFTACAGLKHIGKHMIVSAIEHPAVLNTAKFYKSLGYELDILPVDTTGKVDLAKLANLLRDDTILVSVMAANNEVGTIQPLAEIGELLKDRPTLFHTDAVQAFPYEKIAVKNCNIDLLSLSAHKFNGPKGIGALYINEDKRELYNLPALIHGGSQERERRAGTLAVPLIAALGAALKFHLDNLPTFKAHVKELRDYLWAQLQKIAPEISLNGDFTNSLVNILNVCIPNLQGETALIMLDFQQVCASHGSACASGSLDPSPVLLAMGKSIAEAESSLRFSLGYENTKADVDALVKILAEIIDC